MVDETRTGLQNTGEAETKQLLELWIDGKSGPTARAYLSDLRAFAKLEGQTVECAVSNLLSESPRKAHKSLLSHVILLRGGGYAPATINRRMASFRSLLKLARMIGLIDWSVEIKNERTIRYRDTRGPGLAAVSKLLKSLPDNPTGKRDRAIIRLMIDLGLRRNEIAELENDDYEGESLEVIGKGYREATILSVPEPTQLAIDNWLIIRPPGSNGRIFVGISGRHAGQPMTGGGLYKMLQRRAKEAGLEPIRPHGIRHTAITQAAEIVAKEGMSFKEVTQFSRHSDIRTAEVYCDRVRNTQGLIARKIAEVV